MTNAKWKDFLLKSGLPFEHLVAAILARNKWSVDGPYSYSRKNESGIYTEFSVDLHSYFEFTSQTHWLTALNLLIECKYSSPGTNWIFSPHPASSTLFSGLIKVLDQLANKRLASRRQLEDVENDIPYCIRGVSLFDNGFDENVVTRGVNQLRYAMPRFAERTFSYQAMDMCDEEIAVNFACAILVTSAPIFVLKDELTLETVYQANTIEDVATQCGAVIVWNRDAPDREQYADEIYVNLIEDNPKLVKRVSDYSSVFPNNKLKPYYEVPSLYNVQRSIREAGDHVLVLHIDFLEQYLKKIRNSVKKTTRSIRTLANVSYDAANNSILVTPRDTSERAT